jgi:hypothetical protein
LGGGTIDFQQEFESRAMARSFFEGVKHMPAGGRIAPAMKQAG